MFFPRPSASFVKIKTCKFCIIAVVLFMLTIEPHHAQERKIDSLKFVLKGLPDNAAKVDVLNELCWLNSKSSPESGLFYCNKAKALSAGINYTGGAAKNFMNYGTLNYYQAKYEDAIDNYQSALELYASLPDTAGMVFCLRSMSGICKVLNDDSSALVYILRSAGLNELNTNKDELANDHIRIAVLYKNEPDYNKALEHYGKAAQLKGELGKKHDQAAIYNNMGILQRKVGELDQCLDLYLKALKIKEELGDIKGIMNSTNNIGALYWYLEDYEAALNYYESSLVLSKELDDEYGIAMSINNIANVHHKTHHLDQAMELYIEALAKLEKLDVQADVAAVLSNIGDINLKKGLLQEALNYHTKALTIKEKHNLAEGIASSLKDIGSVYLAMSDSDKAIAYNLKSADKAKSIGALYVLAEAYENLSESYSKAGQVDNTLKYYKLHVALKDSIDNYETYKKMSRSVSEYERPASAEEPITAATKGISAAVVCEDEVEAKGEYYALLLATEDYQPTSGLLDLQHPIDDAEALMELLTTTYNFKRENITLIKNPRLLEITAALESMANTLTSEDNLLIYYAGHGHWDKNFERGYWLPQDAQKNNRGSWFSNTELQDYLRAIKCKHTLLVADACFSGSIFAISRDALIGASKSVNLKYKLPSRNAITSGTLETVPDESIFMKYFLKQLSSNRNKYLAAGELFYSLQNAVANNSYHLPQYGTIRDTGHEGGDFIFIKRE